jgi:hypothetical protein
VPVAADGETVAVKVTLLPVVVLLGDAERVVVVAVSDAEVTVTETALEVLAA